MVYNFNLVGKQFIFIEDNDDTFILQSIIPFTGYYPEFFDISKQVSICKENNRLLISGPNKLRFATCESIATMGGSIV